MPSAETFRSVAEILLDHVPDGTDISAIEVTYPDAHWRVRVRTFTPGRVIGRRGATADAIRSAIAEQLDDSRLRLDIQEVPGPGDPPPGPPAGDREPIGLGGGGYVAPDPGTQVTFPAKSGPRKTPPPTVYMAICTQQHRGGAPFRLLTRA